jgi:2,5-diketo-D-gluconate reductase B
MSIPLIGLGTYRLNGAECTHVVKEALEIGYRHIDTAISYENHREIGKAIKGFAREDLYLTSKFMLDLLDNTNVEDLAQRILDELQIDYLDQLLIHWPDRNRPLGAVLEEMNQLVIKGQVRAIGVSNFTIHHLQDALEYKIPFSVNQVEFHPYLYQKELLQFCRNHAIQLVAYRPLGKGEVAKDPLIVMLGEKYGKTGGQIVLRWITQKRVPAIPKASSKKHLKENFNIFDFFLDEEDIQAIDRLNRNQRFCMTDAAEFNY